MPVRSPPLRHPVGLERHGQLLLVGESRQGEPPEIDHRHGDHDKLSPYTTVPGGKAGVVTGENVSRPTITGSSEGVLVLYMLSPEVR